MSFVGFSDRIELALEDRGFGVFTVEVKPLSEYARKRLIDRLERVRLGLLEELRFWQDQEK